LTPLFCLLIFTVYESLIVTNVLSVLLS